MLRTRHQLPNPIAEVEHPKGSQLFRMSLLWDDWYSDLQTVLHHSPSCKFGLALLLSSSSFQALALHRLAHWFHSQQLPFLPRFISHLNRFLTGIEIHPGAQIGRGVYIAHGMGIVIGETAIVGDGALIYQDVTLGGTGKETGKRHPTLGSQVVIEAGAKVLGNICIGDRVRIGAGSIVLRDISSDSVVTGVPGRVIYRGSPSEPLPSDEMLPDLEAQVIQILFERLKVLETQTRLIKAELQSGESVKLASFGDQAIAESDQLIEDFLDGAGI
jgi:serine O-acetyltransferase